VIWANTQKYRDIQGPILAIFAAPHEAYAEKQIASFEKGLPNARVVRIPNAQHYVFQSNESDVLREMNAFIGGLAR
jgi:non-heme chloroperoxidase